MSFSTVHSRNRSSRGRVSMAVQAAPSPPLEERVGERRPLLGIRFRISREGLVRASLFFGPDVFWQLLPAIFTAGVTKGPPLPNPLLQRRRGSDPLRTKVAAPRCALARTCHTGAVHLNNTEALARRRGELWLVEPRKRSGFVPSRGKPLKRLTPRSISIHRAKAPVLMRSFWYGCEISWLGASTFHNAIT